MVNLTNSTSECLLQNIAGILRKKETKNNLQSDAELHLSRHLLYKTSFKPKVLLGSREAGGKITPAKPACLILLLLLLLMLIENTSVIDGAGNGFSFVCGDDDFVKFQTQNHSKHVTLTKSILRLNDFLKCMTRQRGENGQCS